MEIEVQGCRWQLLAERAIYWPEKKSLWLADPHFGKVSHFRKAGIAVPPAAAASNFDKLQALLQRLLPAEVVILGDLFHSDYNSEWATLTALLAQHPAIHFHLVMGNHDVLPPSHYQNFEIHRLGMMYPPFYLSHHPQVHASLYNVAGHIHPGVHLRGEGRQSLRLPAFVLGGQGAILPAFGEFTGLHAIKPKKEDRIFVVAQRQIMAVH